MKTFLDKLNALLAENPPNFGDSASALALLYEAYNEVNPMDSDRIKADFNALYQRMNGMELREMDRIIYPVCTLCRDHERSGFMEGIRVGIHLAQELTAENTPL